ncbi:MAG: efflux RND transporter periplasmic adaptor subunit [Cyclobacteriaceae bacterium]
MSRKLISFLLVIIIISGAVFAFRMLASQKKSLPQRPKPEAKNYVKVQKYEPERVETTIEAFGRVNSSQQINLIAEVGGKLLKGAVALKEGQSFKQGQLLCSIYSEEQKLNLKAQKSRFLNTLASVLPDLKIDFSDNFDTWHGYFNQINLEKDLPTIPSPKSSKEKTFLATKNILSDYYAIKSAEENLRKYNIYAPFSGSIRSVNFQTESVVNPGTNIAELIRTDELELEIACEVRDISFIEIGKKVDIISEAPSNQKWEGTVSRISDFVDANTQSIGVFITVSNEGRIDVREGSFLMASIPGKTISGAIRIPRSVIKNKNEVFVVKDSVLKTMKIKVHKLNENTAVISGLKDGDLLVTDMPSNASENMKVEIIKG